MADKADLGNDLTVENFNFRALIDLSCTGKDSNLVLLIVRSAVLKMAEEIDQDDKRVTKIVGSQAVCHPDLRRAMRQIEAFSDENA